MQRTRLILWGICLSLCLAGWAPRQPERAIRAGLYENAPKIYSDANGEAAGVWPDLLESIAADENWQIVWVRCSWNACLDLLKQGQIDIMPDVALTDERSAIYTFSNETVLTSWSRLYVPRGDKIETVLELQDKKVAGLAGSLNFEGPDSIRDMVLRFGIQSTFIEKNSYDEVFKALEERQVDAGVVNKDYGNFNEKNYAVDRTPIILQPGDIRFAFNRNSSLTPYLLQTIDRRLKELKQTPDSVYYQALEKNMGEKVPVPATQNMPPWVGTLLIVGGGLILFLLAVNVTAQGQVKRQTAQLRASEARQQALLNNIPDLIFRFSKDGTFLDYHAASEEMLYLQPQEFMGKNVAEALPKNLAKATLKYIHLAITTQKMQVFEYQTPINGSLHDFEARYTASGEEEVLVIVRDITARKLAEKELRESEQRYQTLANVSPVGIFRTDKDGSTTYVNPTWCRISGMPAEKGLGDGWLEGVHPDDRLRLIKNWQKSVDIHSVSLADYRFIRPDGSTAWVIGQAVPELNSENEITGFVGTITDITERKLVEEALRQSKNAERAAYTVTETLQAANLALARPLDLERILEIMLDHLAQLVPFDNACVLLLEDADNLVVHAIRGYKAGGQEVYTRSTHAVIYSVIEQGRYLSIKDTGRFPGWPSGEMLAGSRSWLGVPLIAGGQVLGLYSLGKKESNFFTAQHSELAEALAAQAAIAIQNARLLETLQFHADELEQRVSERTTELAGRVAEVENLNNAMISLMDDLQAALKKAESADRLKSAFLATMSHELRTPLNSIIGFTGILLQKMVGPLSDEQEKQLKMVQSSARHLLELINDVLDISKIEADQMIINCAPFDLAVSIQKSVDKVLPMAHKKGLTFSINIDPPEIIINSDRRRVEQILLNLLNNAVKFTEQGGIQLKANVQNDDYICISISDSGIGIKAENLRDLFTPFRQVDTGITRQYEGTGLGLSICKRLVELLDGQIWVESEWGRGSTFSFTLPYQRKQA